MNSIIQYIFEVTLGSSLLFLGFYLVRNFLPLRFKRFYLLGCIVLPLVFPLISFDYAETIITQVPSQVSQVFIETGPQINLDMTSSEPVEVPTQAATLVKEADSTINWKYIFILLYGLVSMILLIRFSISLLAIYRLSKNPVGEEDGKKFFLIRNQNFTGGSFFHFIFINERYLNNPAFKTILSHEHAHLRLFHSLDIMLSELFCVCFWINPTAWILKREIRLNAEYEADLVSAKSFGEEHYANTLLNLSITSQNIGPMLSFSAMDTRKRLKNILGIKKTRWFTTFILLPFLLLATWLISCEPEMIDFAAMDPHEALKNVKTITSSYISHQKDTQQKDSKVIAEAYYLPNGTVDKVVQYMSYPYDYENSFDHEFITNPDPVGVQYIMDGLDLGIAENNLLYGNDWPKHFTDQWKLRNSSDKFFSKRLSIERNKTGLPLKLTTEIEIEDTGAPRYVDLIGEDKQIISNGVTNTKIIEYSYTNGNLNQIMEVVKVPQKIVLIGSNHGYKIDKEELTKKVIGFYYENDNLIEVKGTEGNYKFSYQNGVLVKSEYYLNGKKYNYRMYYYNSDGLKTRTEIYNLYGEPEYTIIYDYEYF